MVLAQEELTVVQKFIIVSQARSGSTLLRRMLNSARRVSCHGEVLGINKVLGYFTRKKYPELPEDPADRRSFRDEIGVYRFIDEYVLEPQQEFDAKGFKVLNYQLLHPSTAADVEQYLKNHPDLKVIMLHREDQFARLLSDQARKVSLELPHARRVRPEDLDRFMRSSFENHEAVQKFFSDREVLRFSYEQLIADFDQTIAALTSFFDHEEWKLKIQTSPSKIRDHREWLPNYDPLHRRYQQLYAERAAEVFRPIFANEERPAR